MPIINALFSNEDLLSMIFFISMNSMKVPFLTIFSYIKINNYCLLSTMNQLKTVETILAHSPKLLIQTDLLQNLFRTVFLKYLVSFIQKSTLQFYILLYVNVLDGKYQFFEYYLLDRYSQKRQHYRIQLNLLDYLVLFLDLGFCYFKFLFY